MGIYVQESTTKDILQNGFNREGGGIETKIPDQHVQNTSEAAEGLLSVDSLSWSSYHATEASWIQVFRGLVELENLEVYRGCAIPMATMSTIQNRNRKMVKREFLRGCPIYWDKWVHCAIAS
jgi:hypothetical protein